MVPRYAVGQVRYIRYGTAKAGTRAYAPAHLRGVMCRASCPAPRAYIHSAATAGTRTLRRGRARPWLYISAQLATAVRSASQVRSTANSPTFSSGKRPRISSQKEGCLHGIRYVELAGAFGGASCRGSRAAERI